MKNLYKQFGTQIRPLLSAVCIIAFTAVIVFTMAGCPDVNDDTKGGGSAVTYTGTDSSRNTYSLKITEKTSRAAYAPKSGDSYALTITLANGTVKISRGTVTVVTAGGTFTLKPSTAGSQTFSVTISGVQITAVTGKIVLEGGGTLDGPGPMGGTEPGGEAAAAAFTGLTADGGETTATTTKLILAFDKDINGLSANDITLTAGATGAVKDALSRTGAGTYELAVNGITVSGEITVTIADKAGYTISPKSRSVNVYYYQAAGGEPVQVAFTDLTANGGETTATTTKLTLAFDKDINSLSANDITLTAGATGAVRGALSRTGTGTYELTVSGITASGEITVTIADKAGYTISPKSRSANVYYYQSSGGETDVFTSIEDMTAWLNEQDDNTADNPYDVKLNVADLTGMSGSAFSGKYVNLDLAGSTFTSIETQFYENQLLTGVIIPKSVTSIGSTAFTKCTSLTAIDVDANNTNYSSEGGVLYNKDKTSLITYPAGKTAASFDIPNGVTSIGDNAFYVCRSLTSVTIPDGVTYIGGAAFVSCKFTSITIPTSVTYIALSAFGSTSLTSVTIPKNVTKIGNYAFSYCTKLISVTFESTITEANLGSYEPFPGDLRDKYLAGGIGTYNRPDTSTTWTKAGGPFTSIEDMTAWLNDQDANTAATPYTVKLNVANLNVDGIPYIQNNSFSGKYVNLDLSGSTMTVIAEGQGNFESCTNLVGITLPNTVIKIGGNAFFGAGLTSITIPASVTHIESYAFSAVGSLISVTFQGTITETNFGSASYFPGDLRDKYLATTGGGPGTYTRPNTTSTTWTKQQN